MTRENSAQFGVLERLLGSPQQPSSPFAPNWHFAALPIPHLQYLAIGSGPDPDDARNACLGETAEILSILYRDTDEKFMARDLSSGEETLVPADQATSRDASSPEDPGNEGAAAGPNYDEAGLSALHERLERAAVHDWWTGTKAPVGIPQDWTESFGLNETIAVARRNTTLRRITRFISLCDPDPIWTMAAVSCNPDGSLPVLGYGAAASPNRAARKAFSELLQMELGLYIALESGRGENHQPQSPVFRRTRSLETHRAPLILPEVEVPLSSLEKEFSNASITEFSAHIPGSVLIVDMTRDDIGVPVCRAITPALPRARPLKFGQDASPL